MTRADEIYAQHADLYGTDPDEQPSLARDWRNARNSHRQLRAGLVVGLLTAAKTQSTTTTPAA